MTENLAPVVTSLNAPFWEAGAAGCLMLPRCPVTGRFFWPPSPVSPFADVAPAWEAADPCGVIQSIAIYHRKFQAPLADLKPHGVGLIELSAGPRLLVHIAEPDAFAVGDLVRLTFAPVLLGLPPVPTIEHPRA